MPLVKDLRERVDKYIAKTPADQTGARYGAAKPIAVARFTEGAAAIFEFRELVRNVLESKGVPSGQQGAYYGFAHIIRKLAWSHTGPTLEAHVNGVIQDFATGKGCDPTILKTIASMILGKVPA